MQRKKISGLILVQQRILGNKYFSTRMYRNCLTMAIQLLNRLFVKIKCDYCDNDIFRDAKLLRVGQYEGYFCCNSCLTLYKQKYRSKIETMSR